MDPGKVLPFPSVEEREKIQNEKDIHRIRDSMDVETARAQVDAGYMTLKRYMEIYCAKE